VTQSAKRSHRDGLCGLRQFHDDRARTAKRSHREGLCGLHRLHEDGPGSIGILAAHEKATPGGTTSAVGPTDVHLAVLTQRGNGAGVPRRSVVMDRRLASACLRQRRAGFESVVSPVAQRLATGDVSTLRPQISLSRTYWPSTPFDELDRELGDISCQTELQECGQCNYYHKFSNVQEKMGYISKEHLPFQGQRNGFSFCSWARKSESAQYQGRTDERGPVFPRQRLSMHPLIPAIVQRRS